MLYVVATPIGNLGDISSRALYTLKTVDLIAAEDTRVTRKLLSAFDIHTPLVSLYQHNETLKGQALAERMVNERLNVALVTDAGTPAVSDPGAVFVRLAVALGIEVQPVPGASAAIAALSISGFDAPSFAFYGFLERGRTQCIAQLEAMRGCEQAVVLYESPHRVARLVETIGEVFPGCPMIACCDLTKKFELTLRGTPETVLAALRANEKSEKGEYCLVLDLRGFEAQAKAADPADTPLEALLVQETLSGQSLREAVSALAEQGFKKNALKAAALRLKEIAEGW